ncbi:MAG: acyl-CoA thioesterase [Sterolibacterium sp.]|jgi:acyl-CoA thioester hydrolase|nr:acyl-CoA thioesterase [Sterolibacterium sp.]
MPHSKPDPRLRDVTRYPFAMTIAPRFADMDILRHLNHLALAEFHEEARTRFFMTLLGEDFLFRKREYRLLPVCTTYDYLHEAHYPQLLEACAGVAHIGHTSFTVAMALFQSGRCVCLSNAVTVHVTVDGASPLPAELRACLQRGLLRDA